MSNTLKSSIIYNNNGKKKIFIFVICFSLLPVILSASGNWEKSEQEPDEKTDGKKITVFLDTTMLQEHEGQLEFRIEFKRLTSIELEIIQPPHQQYMEKLLIQLASGNLPDVCEVYDAHLTQLVNDGVIIPLDEYIKKSSYLHSIYPKFLDTLTYKDGHIYGIQSRDGGGCITYIRKDWLVNLGLRMPATWTEFAAVLRAFTFEDPDGNGKNDTFGYTEPLGISCSDWDLYNRAVMLDARIDIYFKDGKWVDGFQEPGMIKALQRYKSLYAEGVIDRELFTNKTSTARSKLYNDKVGVFSYWANHWARNLWEKTKTAIGDHAELVPMPPLPGQGYIRRIAPLLAITVGCKDPEIVFSSFIDRQYDKGEIQTLFTYGVKGYHWEMNHDGTARFLPNPRDREKNLFMKAYVPPMAIQNDWEQPMPIDPLVMPALELFNKYSKQDPLRAGGEYFAKYYSEITNTLKPEIFAKIILGEYTIKEGLALYTDKVKKLYIDEILAELNN